MIYSLIGRDDHVNVRVLVGPVKTPRACAKGPGISDSYS